MKDKSMPEFIVHGPFCNGEAKLMFSMELDGKITYVYECLKCHSPINRVMVKGGYRNESMQPF